RTVCCGAAEPDCWEASTGSPSLPLSPAIFEGFCANEAVSLPNLKACVGKTAPDSCVSSPVGDCAAPYADPFPESTANAGGSTADSPVPMICETNRATSMPAPISLLPG